MASGLFQAIRQAQGEGGDGQGGVHRPTVDHRTAVQVGVVMAAAVPVHSL